MANIYDVNAAIDKPNLVQAMQQGNVWAQQNQATNNALQQQAQQQQDQQTVRAAAPAALSGDPNASNQIAAISPQAAQQYQQLADQHAQRMIGALQFIDQQPDLPSKEAAYQQTKPFFSQFGATPPDTYEEAAPYLQAAKLHMAMMAAGNQGAPTAEQQNWKMYTNGLPQSDVTQAQRIKLGLAPNAADQQMKMVSVNLPDGSTQQYMQDPQGSLHPLQLAGQGQPQPQVQTTILPPTAQGAQGSTPMPSQPPTAGALPAQPQMVQQANALLSQGMQPEAIMQKLVGQNQGLGGFSLSIDPKTGQFVDSSAQQNAASPQNPNSGSGMPNSGMPQTAIAANPTANAPNAAQGVLGNQTPSGTLGLSGPKADNSTVAKRLKDLQDMQAAGVTVSPDQHVAYLTTGKFPENADAALSPGEEAEAQALATYKLPMSAYQLSKPTMQPLVQRAMQINPNFNATQYAANQKTMTDLASSSPGSSGGTVTAANAALGHLSDMADLSNNLPSHIGLFNAAQNATNTFLNTGDAGALKDWNTGKGLLAGELAKMVKGGVASEGEQQQILDSLNPNDPNRNEALSTAAKFLTDKIQGMEQKRDGVLGPASPGTSLLNANAQTQAKKLIGMGGNYTVPQFLPPGSLSNPNQGMPTAQTGINPGVAALLAKYGAH